VNSRALLGFDKRDSSSPFTKYLRLLWAIHDTCISGLSVSLLVRQNKDKSRFPSCDKRLGFPTSYFVVFFMVNELKWEVVVHFVDIGGIIDYHCSNCDKSRFPSCDISLQLTVKSSCIVQTFKAAVSFIESQKSTWVHPRS
jgi:hypothetical protein